MPIVHPQGPAGGHDALATHLAEALGHDDLAERVLGGLPLDALVASDPHPVYVLDRAAFGAADPLAAAQLVAWRYLLFHEDQVVAAAELVPSGGGLDLGHVNRGPFVAATIDALHHAESLPEVQQDPFELRLLRAAHLLFAALWLHGPRDIVIPLGRHLTRLEAQRAYTPGEVLTELRHALRARGH